MDKNESIKNQSLTIELPNQDAAIRDVFPGRKKGEDGGSQEPSSVIDAAQWLAEQPGFIDRPIAKIRSEFKLSALQACHAAVLARKFRISRKAFG